MLTIDRRGDVHAVWSSGWHNVLQYQYYYQWRLGEKNGDLCYGSTDGAGCLAMICYAEPQAVSLAA